MFNLFETSISLLNIIVLILPERNYLFN